jgi:hypothetical protein
MDQIGQEIPDLQVDDIEDSILRCFRWVHRHVLCLRGERRPDSKLGERSDIELGISGTQECRLPVLRRAGCLLHAPPLLMR